MTRHDVRLLVAGATGYVGGHVVRAALARGHRVTAHVRPGSGGGDARATDFERQGARVARTPWQRDAWRDLVTTERPTHLLLLLGTTQARGRRASADGRREDYETIDHDLTALAIDAAVASDAAPGLVYLSAIGARLATRSAYLRVRGRIEARLATCGLAWCAVRPAFITGDDRAESRPVERVTAIAIDTLLAPLRLLGARTIADRYRTVTGAELASLLVGACERPLPDAAVTLDAWRGGNAVPD